MRIRNDDGTIITGPFDVLLILQNEKTGRFHVCFAEEHPLPGPIEEHPKFLRLKSSLVHTGGAATLDEAKVQLAELRKRLIVLDENVFPEPREWDGEPFSTLMTNWRKPAEPAVSPTAN
jgi:hypothetical protein